jgi:undecaprenyl-diphosphatase
MSAAFFLFLGYLGWRLFRGWSRLLLAAGLVVLVLLIGLSRLYLGVHYLTDVIAGYVAGFIWTDTVIVAGHILGRARRVRSTRVARRAGQMQAPPT